MVTVKPDRAIFMFGGQYGEHLLNDLWQWNVSMLAVKDLR